MNIKNILLTRPFKLGQSLANKLKEKGHEVIHVPMIQIDPIDSTDTSGKFHFLMQKVHKFDQYNFAIFMSPNSVIHSISHLQEFWKDKLYNLKIQFTSIGKGTAERLQNFGIKNVVFPKSMPYNSEQFLQLSEMQLEAIQDKRCVIFKGIGGRELIEDTLKERGAQVDVAYCYQRSTPKIEIESFREKMLERLIGKSIGGSIEIEKSREYLSNCIIITSAESLLNLQKICPRELWPFLLQIPIIVVGERVYQLASSLKFVRPYLALGAEDDSILETLCGLKNCKLESSPVL